MRTNEHWLASWGIFLYNHVELSQVEIEKAKERRPSGKQLTP